MDISLNISDLSQPADLVQLKRVIATIGDECDVLYTTDPPNGAIAARLGRRAIYNNSGAYSTWVNVDGGTTWTRIQNYDANIVSIASPQRGTIAIYSSGGWIGGATPTTANLGYYLRSLGWNTDPVYDILDGAVFSNLANITAGAGVIPAANLPAANYHGAQIFLANGNFTAPTGITKVYLTMVGSGGNGGDNLGGGGGGGGSVINMPYTVVPGNVYAVVIGGGGGANTTFDATIVALGGVNASSSTGAAGGGGVDAVTTTPGGRNLRGGGGGNTSGTAGGAGGGTLFGVGALGGAVGNNGVAAADNTGAGGGGAGAGISKVGGSGGSGLCAVIY